MQRYGVPTAAALTLLLGVTAAGAQSGDSAQGKNDQGTAPASQTGQAGGQVGPAADRNAAEATKPLALNKEQQSNISSAVRRADIKPVKDLNLPLTAGTVVPDSVPLVPVPDAIAVVLPQFRNYSFFIDEGQELVFVDPALKTIKALVPVSGEAPSRTTSRTEVQKPKSSTHSGDPGHARANSQPDTQSDTGRSDTGRSDNERSVGSSASRSVAHSKRRTSDVGQVDDFSDDAPSRSITQTDRRRGTVQDGYDRRRTFYTETDVTVGSAPDRPPVIRRMGPPVRPLRPVDPGPPPAQAGPPERGPFGFFDLFR